MLKRICYLFSVALIGLSLCACGSSNSSNSSNSIHKDTESKENPVVESSARATDYEISSAITKVITLDDETIKMLDDVYVALSDAYADLSAQKFYSNVYDAVIAFDSKFQSYLKFEKPTEEQKQFLLDLFDGYNMNVLSVSAAGLNCAKGNVSLENAAFDILVSTDALLNFMYQDYVPVCQPRTIDTNSIFKMYEENELSAEAEFKNQLICVSGTVFEVARDVFEEPYVGLASSKGVSYELLRCYVSSSSVDSISSLKKGDKITCYIQIIDKDTFNINAKLWSFSL